MAVQLDQSTGFPQLYPGGLVQCASMWEGLNVSTIEDKTTFDLLIKPFLC